MLAGNNGIALLNSPLPGWLLPGAPSLQLDFQNARAWLNGNAYYSASAIAALFSTLSPPAHYALGTAGVLYSVPANALDCFTVPRGVCQGQLIEEARTNVRSYSQDFTNGVWSKTGGSILSVTPPPLGNSVNGLFTEDTASSAHGPTDASARVVSGQTTPWTVSAFLQAGTRRYVQLGVAGGGNVAWITIDTQAWAITETGGGQYTASGLIPVAGGYRAYLVQTPVNTLAQVISITGSTTATPGVQGPTYTGTSATIIAWGVLAENGTFPTSYVPTTSASVTRAAANIYRALEAGFAQGAGSAVISFITAPGSGTQKLWQIDDGTANNRISLTRNASNQMMLDLVSGGVSQANVNLGTVGNLTAGKAAIGWSAGAAAGSVNGAAAVTASPSAIPSGLTTERFGVDAAAASQWNGYLKQVTRYKAALSNLQLPSLSQ